MRDNFSAKTKATLALRVNNRCSNPACAKPTSGPADQPNKAVNVGIAAHITAASPGGARYDKAQSVEQRSGIKNGIWLCAACAKLIDDDTDRFSASVLREWIAHAEQKAREGVKASFPVDSVRHSQLGKGKRSSVVSKLLEKWHAPAAHEHVTDASVASRFLRIFEDHGVHRNQVPRFFGHELAPKNVTSEAALMEVLDEPMLEDVCARFGILRAWLDGADTRLHESLDFYQQPEKFSQLVATLKSRSNGAEIEALAVTPSDLQRGDEGLLIIAEPVGIVGDTAIYRYHLCGNWRVDYWKSRAYFTACLAIAWKNDIFVQGRVCKNADIDAVRQGEAAIGPVFKRLMYSSYQRWHTDDLALQPEAYLEGVNRETDNFGQRAALQLWLDLESKGLMDTGHGTSARQQFEAALLSVNGYAPT